MACFVSEGMFQLLISVHVICIMKCFNYEFSKRDKMSYALYYISTCVYMFYEMFNNVHVCIVKDLSSVGFFG